MKIRFNPRICILCAREYKPITSNQKVCRDCRPQYDREFSRKYNKKYISKNRKRLLEKVKLWQKKCRLKRKSKIMSLLGNKCVNHLRNYGNQGDDIRVLQIDHVNGGGTKEISKWRSNSMGYYKYIIENFSNLNGKYQLLCSNCNWIKRYEKKELDFIK